MSKSGNQIEFGWAAAPLTEQFERMGVRVDPAECQQWQSDSAAISRLRLRHIITASEGDRAYDRLAKVIRAAIAAATGGAA